MNKVKTFIPVSYIGTLEASRAFFLHVCDVNFKGCFFLPKIKCEFLNWDKFVNREDLNDYGYNAMTIMYIMESIFS